MTEVNSIFDDVPEEISAHLITFSDKIDTIQNLVSDIYNISNDTTDKVSINFFSFYQYKDFQFR